MNSVPNSESEQCTESKLGWVHRGHTQQTLTARTLREHSIQAARMAPCRGARWVVSWSTRRHVAGHALPCHCAHARADAPCRRAFSQHCIVALLRYLTTQSRPLSHNTNFCIATISLARPCALPHAPGAG